MLRITDFHVPITADGEVSYNNIEPPVEALAARLRLPLPAIGEAAVLRRGIDARRRNGAPVSYVYQLEFSLVGGDKAEKKYLAANSRGRDGVKNLTAAPEPLPAVWEMAAELRGKLSAANDGLAAGGGEARPVVVGFGPAGMFAALLLARAGLSPLVLERGADVESRTVQVADFWAGKTPLDTATNVQFGEGGAGTFSDGKLTTRVDSPLIRDVLSAMVEFGAPEEIKFLHKPHIGTDELVHVVKNLRQEIIACGGEVRFLTTVRELEYDSSRSITAVVTEDGQRIRASAVFLGIGHSARDTYHRLRAMGVAMEPKPFAVGVRIEHPQEIIDRAQYGRPAVGKKGEPSLPVADYSLTWQDRSNPDSRSVYSFCMCPGGKVVAAASEEGRLVTNGMSLHARDSGVANAALLVNVRPEDFGGDVLGGIDFQRKYEELAYRAGGGDYTAPVQAVGDFIATVEGSPRCDTRDFCVAPTYRPGVKNTLLADCLPEFVTASLAVALPAFDRKIKGFGAADVPITGVEMRSSAPCRIIRDRGTYQSLSHGRLYPIGEGAGYAGGIMSAACDGLNAVLAYLRGLGL